MFGGERRFIIGMAAATSLLLAALPSHAVTRDQLKWCEAKEDASPDLRITSCTAVIEQKNVKKQQKADAFANRGKAYRAKGDSDRAIADFDEALKLDGKNGEAYFNRGLAFRDRGETDRALQDLEQTVKFDKRNSTALDTLFTFCPPGPGARTKRKVSSSSSNASCGVMLIIGRSLQQAVANSTVDFFQSSRA